MCLIIFKSLNDMGPSYLTQLLQQYVPGHRSLRSTKQGLLQKQIAKHQCGQRIFQVLAPNLWNSLPEYIKLSNSVNTFKKNLKTYLYSEVFAYYFLELYLAIWSQLDIYISMHIVFNMLLWLFCSDAPRASLATDTGAL